MKYLFIIFSIFFVKKKRNYIFTKSLKKELTACSNVMTKNSSGLKYSLVILEYIK